ncbi:MAG: YfhO family protein, partial [Cyanobacteriota bacterium]
MEKKSPLILFVPYIILIVLILGFFYKVVLLNYNFFWRDILSHSYPAKKILIDSIIAGYFPLWNPYVSTGIPYLADLSNQSLYIFNILFLILPSSEAINFTILSHYILCAIFMYLFVKDLTENKYISIFAGVSFPLSGYCVSLNCNLEYLSAIIWLPAVFWSYYRVINTEKTIYLFLTALFLSMLIFGGEPMAFYYLLGFICLHCLFQLKDKKQLLKEAVLIIIICLGSLIISSVQLLPALEFASLSNRSGGLSFAEATIWSFNPLRLIEFILPFFYGHNFPYPRYWGTFLQAGTFNVPWAESVYIGVVPFFLALFSLYFSKTKEKFYWVSVILISLFLSFGCFTPIYKLLFNIIPMLSSFRYPEKIIIFATFGLIVLASLTLLDLFNNQEHKFPKYVLIVFTLPILITIICFFLDFSTIINLKNMAISGEVDRWFINFNTRFRLIYFSLILLSLAGSYLYIVKRLKKIEYFLIFIIIFTFLDLLNINSNAYLTTNVNFFTY